MDTLNAKLIKTVANSLKGKRLEKFMASIEVLNTSLEQGEWISRGSVKAESGFYQGLYGSMPRETPHPLFMCFRFGYVLPETCSDAVAKMNPVEQAWVKLCAEKAVAVKFLNDARPKPKRTEIGLSPKVTKTFQECGLDLDIASIKPAEIKSYETQDRDPKTGELLFTKKGEPVMVRIYYVAWTPGTLFHRSRFAHCDCQACGKTIPSRRFVAIEADCKLNGHIGLWVGCDCAKNIFGITDVGIDRNAKAPEEAK